MSGKDDTLCIMTCLVSSSNVLSGYCQAKGHAARVTWAKNEGKNKHLTPEGCIVVAIAAAPSIDVFALPLPQQKSEGEVEADASLDSRPTVGR